MFFSVDMPSLCNTPALYSSLPSSAPQRVIVRCNSRRSRLCVLRPTLLIFRDKGGFIWELNTPGSCSDAYVDSYFWCFSWGSRLLGRTISPALANVPICFHVVLHTVAVR